VGRLRILKTRCGCHQHLYGPDGEPPDHLLMPLADHQPVTEDRRGRPETPATRRFDHQESDGTVDYYLEAEAQ
jgi:hypothetical protein